MGFSQIGNLWMIIFPIIVLLYYFFRKKYETEIISSTLFWETSMKETKVSPYLKNLQQNALLYLQLLALLFMMFILLGPYIPKQSAAGNHMIFIVDTSAVMLAEKNGVTLLDNSKRTIQSLLTDNEGEAFSVITTGREPQLIVREETDSRAVKEAVDQIEPAYEKAYIERSLDFAKSIASGEGASIEVFTDYLDRSSFIEPEEGISYTVHLNEEEIANVSLDKFGALLTEQGAEAIVKLSNQSGKEFSGRLVITDELTGERIAEEKAVLPAEEEQILTFTGLPAASVLKAVFETDDEYDADNEAFALLGTEVSEAIIDSNLHGLIKRAFEAVGLSVSSGSAAELSAAKETAIAVTNDVAMLQEGEAPVLLVGRNDEKTIPVSGIIETGVSSLFTLSDLRDVYVSELYPPFDGFSTLAEIDGRPFIQQSKRGDIVILSDIGLTDWPLHPSFPLFFWSSVEMLRSGSDIAGVFVPNERKAVLSSAEGELELYTLSGEFVSSFTDGSRFVAPAKPGIYKMIDNRKEKYVSVQLEEAGKSVGSGKSFALGGRLADQEKEEGRQPVGWVLIIVVVLLLLAEWEVQRRRGYSN